MNYEDVLDKELQLYSQATDATLNVQNRPLNRQPSSQNFSKKSAIRNAGYDQIFDQDRTIADDVSVATNPILGYSEGEIKKEKFKRQLVDYYSKSSPERSRSKSKIKKLEEARHEVQYEGIIGQMQRYQNRQDSGDNAYAKK